MPPLAARKPLQVQARNLILFSRREAARTGIALPGTDSRAQHIRDQLRASPGDLVRIGVVNGLKGSALVKSIESNGDVALSWNTWQEPAPPPPVALLLAMPRPKVLKRLWRNIPELGVKQIITQAELTPAGYGTSEALRPPVVLKQLLQGLEQAGDTILPRVVLAPALSSAVEYATQDWDAPEAADSSGDGAGTEWGSERVLVQGPAVSRSFQDRASDAKPSSSEDEETLAYPAGKVSFVRQCLQERRELEDAHSERRQAGGSGAGRAVASRWAGNGVTAEAHVQEPLKLVCHPAEPTLLSTTVAQYKEAMNAQGYHVWNWAEVNEERDVARDEDGAGGDHYYGGAAAACDASADGGLADIIAEALNTGAGGEFTSAAPQTTGDATVGTTRLDASKWGLGRVVLAIGPERGWTDAELKCLKEAGFSAVGMGPRTLSSPVAVLSALSICQEALR